MGKKKDRCKTNDFFCLTAALLALYSSISAANTITQQMIATRNIPTPFLAAMIPAASARIPAAGTAVASIIAGKVITERVTYGT